MKKNVLLILSLTSVLLLTGCFLNKNKNNSSGSGDISSKSEDETEISVDPDRVKNQVYYFYLDYSHSEEPFYTMEWYTLVPLGKCPEVCKLTEKDASDPLFNQFLCWSEYSSSIDDSHAWKFATDCKAAREVKLYGIWVSTEQEVL